MTELDATTRDDLMARYPELFRSQTLRRFRAPVAVAATVAYLAFAWWLFSVGTVLHKASWELAGAYLADWVSYEVRPDVKFAGDHLAVEYPRFNPLGRNPDPAWVKTEKAVVTRKVEAEAAGRAAPSTSTRSAAGSFMAPAAPATSATPSTSTRSSADSFMAPAARNTEPSVGGQQQTAGAPAAEAATATETVVTGATIAIGKASIRVVPRRVTVDYAGKSYTVTIGADGSVRLEGSLPPFARQSEPGGNLRFSFGFPGSIEIRDDVVKVRHRFWGWANFVFDTNSPFFGKSASEVFALVTKGERINPARSNLALAWDNILNNAEWQHGDVWIKLFQTVVMAFVGTLFATLLAFPLAFVAARNITPSRIANQVTKRFFDFQRCVDMLIWALFFTRAFGPGPLAGMSAIFFTDTGTLGKLYAEALENIDDKQREGIRSVGAEPVLVQRYGVLPQVLPIFASQSLYFWESNTRSATIIGAVGAGGIGLKLWEAMRTNANWENVAYMVLLILGTVFLFDAISNAIRSRLIKPSNR